MPPPIPPRGNHYKGRDLIFEGIPASGDKLVVWKLQVMSDVFRAANLTTPNLAPEYIEMAFKVNASE